MTSVSPADFRMWTHLELPEDEVSAFAPSAETRLDSDGGDGIGEPVRTQLVCYLIAYYHGSAAGETSCRSETIGDYSYTAETKTTVSSWLDRYTDILKSMVQGASKTSYAGFSGLVPRTADSDMVHLNRTFGR